MVDHDIGVIIQIIDNCIELHTLPKPGGLFDQDALFMYIYNKVHEFRTVRAELDNQASERAQRKQAGSK